MVCCFAACCNHRSVKNKCKFFRFPKDKNQRALWMALLRRSDKWPSDDSRLCSCHFEDGKKENDPTIFFYSEVKKFNYRNASCDVVDCESKKNKNKSYFSLPKIVEVGSVQNKILSEQRRRMWLLALRRADLTEDKEQSVKICEDHFISGKPANLMEVDDADWVPSRNMGYIADKNLKKRLNLDETLKKTLQLKVQVPEVTSSPPPSPVKVITPSETVTSNPTIISISMQPSHSSPVNDPPFQDSLQTSDSLGITTESDSENESLTQACINQSCQTDLSMNDIISLEQAYRDTICEIADLRKKVEKLEGQQPIVLSKKKKK